MTEAQEIELALSFWGKPANSADDCNARLRAHLESVRHLERDAAPGTATRFALWGGSARGRSKTR